MDTNITTFTFDLARLVRSWVLQWPGTPLKLFTVQGTYLHLQREELVEEALKANVSHVLFLDSDMRFPPDLLERLLQRGKSVIGVNYSMRRKPLLPTAVKEGKPYFTFVGEDEPELEQVESLGMGAMLIDAAILQRIPTPRFWPQTPRPCGEDVYFCLQVKRLGESVWVDNQLSTRIAHTGQIEYTMDDAITYNLRQAQALQEGAK